ncbi:WD40 repeat domain-containing protein [Catenuloplanes sp. NPDC051500]|uniref:WD40 repeat domain-containing protein n=1 Tax=Catenuloplanes sp. NPDC051500 TaxID=3363959 RepID=UPI0037BE0023
MYQVGVRRQDGVSTGHAAPQTAVAFSPDATRYASGGYDGRVVVWDRATGGQLWSGSHVRLVNAVRFASSGRLLASASADKTCRIWDAADGSLVQQFARQPDDLNSLAWIDDDLIVTVSQDGTGRIWNLSTGTLDARVLFHSDHLMSVDVADGLLVTCGEDAKIKFWQPDGTLHRVVATAGHAEMCRWSPSGMRLAASCDDGFVHILDREGELVTKIGPYVAAVKAVAWSPDGTRIAVGAYDSTVCLWDVESGELISRWHGGQLWPRSLDYAADGSALIVGTIATTPRVIEIGTTAEAIEPAAPTRGVNHLSVNGGLLAAGCDDSTIRVWDDPARPARLIEVGDGSLINTVGVAPDAARIAYGTFSGRIGVADSRTGEVLVEERREHPINRVAWSPSGRFLAVADYEGVLDIYEVSGTRLAPHTSYAGHDGAIKDVSWLDDEHLTTYSTDRTTRLVTLSGGMLHVFTGHGELINGGSVTVIGGRRVLATVARDRSARVYDVDTGALLTVLSGHDESVKSVAWHPGGEPVLLTGSYDFTARLWTLDPQTWRTTAITPLTGHENAIPTVCWLSDTPVTGSWDGTVRVWSVPDGGAPVARELA